MALASGILENLRDEVDDSEADRYYDSQEEVLLSDEDNGYLSEIRDCETTIAAENGLVAALAQLVEVERTAFEIDIDSDAESQESDSSEHSCEDILEIETGSISSQEPAGLDTPLSTTIIGEQEEHNKTTRKAKGPCCIYDSYNDEGLLRVCQQPAEKYIWCLPGVQEIAINDLESFSDAVVCVRHVNVIQNRSGHASSGRDTKIYRSRCLCCLKWVTYSFRPDSCSSHLLGSVHFSCSVNACPASSPLYSVKGNVDNGTSEPTDGFVCLDCLFTNGVHSQRKLSKKGQSKCGTQTCTAASATCINTGDENTLSPFADELRTYLICRSAYITNAKKIARAAMDTSVWQMLDGPSLSATSLFEIAEKLLQTSKESKLVEIARLFHQLTTNQFANQMILRRAIEKSQLNADLQRQPKNDKVIDWATSGKNLAKICMLKRRDNPSTTISNDKLGLALDENACSELAHFIQGFCSEIFAVRKLAREQIRLMRLRELDNEEERLAKEIIFRKREEVIERRQFFKQVFLVAQMGAIANPRAKSSLMKELGVLSIQPNRRSMLMHILWSLGVFPHRPSTQLNFYLDACKLEKAAEKHLQETDSHRKTNRILVTIDNCDSLAKAFERDNQYSKGRRSESVLCVAAHIVVKESEHISATVEDHFVAEQIAILEQVHKIVERTCVEVPVDLERLFIVNFQSSQILACFANLALAPLSSIKSGGVTKMATLKDEIKTAANSSMKHANTSQQAYDIRYMAAGSNPANDDSVEERVSGLIRCLLQNDFNLSYVHHETPKLVICTDESLASRLYKLKERNPFLRDHLEVWIGGFHANVAIMEAITSVFSGFGLYQLALIIGVTYLDKFEKHVSAKSSWRIFEALWCALGIFFGDMQQHSETLSELLGRIKKKVLQPKGSFDLRDELLAVLACFFEAMTAWMAHQVARRTGNFALEVEALRYFLPYFVASGKSKYAYWVQQLLVDLFVKKNGLLEFMANHPCPVLKGNVSGHLRSYDEVNEQEVIKTTKETYPFTTVSHEKMMLHSCGLNVLRRTADNLSRILFPFKTYKYISADIKSMTNIVMLAAKLKEATDCETPLDSIVFAGCVNIRSPKVRSQLLLLPGNVGSRVSTRFVQDVLKLGSRDPKGIRTKYVRHEKSGVISTLGKRKRQTADQQEKDVLQKKLQLARDYFRKGDNDAGDQILTDVVLQSSAYNQRLFNVDGSPRRSQKSEVFSFVRSRFQIDCAAPQKFDYKFVDLTTFLAGKANGQQRGLFDDQKLTKVILENRKKDFVECTNLVYSIDKKSHVPSVKCFTYEERYGLACGKFDSTIVSVEESSEKWRFSLAWRIPTLRWKLMKKIEAILRTDLERREAGKRLYFDLETSSGIASYQVDQNGSVEVPLLHNSFGEAEIALFHMAFELKPSERKTVLFEINDIDGLVIALICCHRRLRASGQHAFSDEWYYRYGQNAVLSVDGLFKEIASLNENEGSSELAVLSFCLIAIFTGNDYKESPGFRPDHVLRVYVDEYAGKDCFVYMDREGNIKVDEAKLLRFWKYLFLKVFNGDDITLLDVPHDLYREELARKLYHSKKRNVEHNKVPSENCMLLAVDRTVKVFQYYLAVSETKKSYCDSNWTKATSANGVCGFAQLYEGTNAQRLCIVCDEIEGSRLTYPAN